MAIFILPAIICLSNAKRTEFYIPVKPMKFLISAKDEVFGLDIGSSCVKAVQLRRENSGYKLVAASRTDIDRRRQADARKDIVAAIRGCFKRSHIKTTYAVCGLAGADVVVRTFRLSGLTPDKIDTAVVAEAEQVCPFEIDQCVLDYQVLTGPGRAAGVPQTTESAGQTSGILAAATTDVIRNRIQLARAAKLRCVMIDVEGLALLNCLCECENPSATETFAVLDVGSSCTNLAIFRRNLPPFMRDMAYGGDGIIGAISAETNITKDKLQKMLYDSTQSGTASYEAGDILAAGCENLIVDITETLRYYMLHNNVSVDKVLVCGGFGQAKGFVELLSRRFSSKVELWNPFDKIDCDAESISAETVRRYGPSMAVAAGLAMRKI